MPRRIITLIVIHCAATANGVRLARVASPGHDAKTAAQVIDGWHRERGFHRTPEWMQRFNPQFGSLGYHYVIDTDGTTEPGRHVDEQGAHAKGHNLRSLGLCMVGTDRFTIAQWVALKRKVSELRVRYPNARIAGHRDLSPDLNGDGQVEPNEWTKICPGFNATDWWLTNSMQPMSGHLCVETPR
ncbi:MAG TPA: N-acetylmuramoyl-L-alanine amidase [Steroidobacteraceae bacterium]|nr:N-acetylmuramoyl-L-alanine amidase [Steroidobacteraceae bacterium]